MIMLIRSRAIQYHWSDAQEFWTTVFSVITDHIKILLVFA